jgi:hypothetical protein
VLEATARSAANSAYSGNSAILFYRKIRKTIAHHLDFDVHPVLENQVELDESYFCDLVKVDVDVAWPIKRRRLTA